MRLNYTQASSTLALSNRSLPKPETWQEFEHHAWLLFRAELNDPATEKNGRQGQAQHGVDVYGRRDCKHWVGVQCKQKMDEAVSEAELREEVEQAKLFSPKIKEYILVTTARRDAGIQKAAREITDELTGTEHEFSVSVWGWDQFQEHASMHSDVWEKIDPTWDPYTKRGLEQLNVSIGELKDTVSAALPDEGTSKRRIQQMIDLAFLAPDILRDVIDGKQPLGLTSEWLLRHDLPSDWQEQRALVATL